MPYQVQFVGLVCFYRERGARLALLPDGRLPDDGIEPHQASIMVDPDSVEASNGWGHIGDTISCFLLFLERHPVRPRSCGLLELRLAIALSRR